MITYRYDAYGNTTKSNNTLNNPYQYNAEYTDSSTGLQYLRARYYDSSQGRFTTKDSVYGLIQLPITFNPYTYVCNNPLNFIDPSGEFFKGIFGTVAGGARALWDGVGGLATGKGTSGFKSGWNKGKADGQRAGAKWDSGIKNSVATTVNYYQDENSLIINSPSNVANGQPYYIPRDLNYNNPTKSVTDKIVGASKGLYNNRQLNKEYDKKLSLLNTRINSATSPKEKAVLINQKRALEQQQKELCREMNKQRIDVATGTLDLISYIPVIGIPADVINITLYASQKQWTNVVLSSISLTANVVFTVKMVNGVKPSSDFTFADETKLLSHYEKHGSEFKGLYNSADEYLEGAQNVIKNGYKVEYMYKGENTTGYVQFFENNQKGNSKFAFVGTNSDGYITTYHTDGGKDFWKMLNGENVKVINPK